MLAFDHRGHGEGIRTRRPFRLDRLRRRRRRRWPTSSASTGSSRSGTRWAAPSPSSCGGGTRRRVGGIVLCATATTFNGTTDRAAQLPRPRRARRDGPADAAAPVRRSDRRSLPARSPRRLGDRGHASRPRARTGGRCSRRAPRSAGSIRSWLTETRRAGGGGRDDSPTRWCRSPANAGSAALLPDVDVFTVDGGPRRRRVGAAVRRDARRGDRLGRDPRLVRRRARRRPRRRRGDRRHVRRSASP